jgi:SAM-dependent MidA family methyltransferase
MTPAGEKIAAEIRRSGPVEFSRFMEIALYDAQCGYYRTPRNVFGRSGDFYTAEQLQPVFGRVVAAAVRALPGAEQDDQRWRVVEWGAGREEMREALAEFGYAAVDIDRDEAPLRFRGVAFSNEWFDALPVDVARRDEDGWRRMRVGLAGESFVWTAEEELDGEWREFAALAGARFEGEEPAWIELPVRAAEALASIDRRLEQGHVIAVDYGFTERERVRFRGGSLMSYRRHRASEDVLRAPGEQDLTAHVPFDYLSECAARLGWTRARLESLAVWMMRVGERDQFAGALVAADEAEALKLRLQLKTLLFGLGETFHVAQWSKKGH